MKVRRTWFWIGFLLASFLGTSFAKADDLAAPPNSLDVSEKNTTTAWIGVSGRFGYYDMSDVNEAFEPIDNGPTAGLELGIRAGSTFGFVGHFERMFAQSELSDSTGFADSDLAGNLFYVSVEVSTSTARWAALGMSLGVGSVWIDGNLDVTLDGEQPVRISMNGQGPFLQGLVFIEAGGPTRFRVVPSFGYRYAKAESVTLEKERIWGFSVDYSGLVAGLSFRFML